MTTIHPLLHRAGLACVGLACLGFSFTSSLWAADVSNLQSYTLRLPLAGKET